MSEENTSQQVQEKQEQLQVSNNNNKKIVQIIEKEVDPLKKRKIDVFEHFHLGNYSTITMVLSEKIININDQYEMGFTILHYCCLFNLQEYFLYIMEKYSDEININILNDQKQSPLMTAVNSNSIEIIKVLIEKGADYRGMDQFHFTNLLYCVKNNNLPLFFILLKFGCDINDKDINGSGIQHWAAYKNNVNLLRFCKKMGLDTAEKDIQGKTPLMRAVSNTSYQTIKYLANEHPQQINQALFKSTKSESIKLILQKAKDLHDNTKISTKIINQFKTNNTQSVLTVYFIYAISLVYTYFSTPAVTYNNQFFSIAFSFLVMYGCMFMIWFLVTVPKKYNQKGAKYLAPTSMREQQDLDVESSQFQPIPAYLKDIDLNDFTYMDFDALDKLVLNNSIENQNEDEENMDIERQTVGLLGNSDISKSFIHELAVLFEDNKFTRIRNIDYDRFCYTCLKYKQIKTVHCSICNQCVPDFNHHSIFFGKCINIQNHFFYFFILCIQEAILSSFFGLLFLYSNSIRTSWITYIYFETFYILQKQNLYLVCIFYLIFSVMWFYNSLYLLIEFYGVCERLTYHEIINIERYRYLFCLQKKFKKIGQHTPLMVLKLRKYGIYKSFKIYITKSIKNVKIG